MKIIKNTSIYTIGNILPQATNFLLLPVYTKYLTPSDYGIVASMSVLQTILGIFFSFAIERSVYRLYYDYNTEESKKKFLSTINLSIFFSASLFTGVIFLFSGVIQRVFPSISFYPYFLYTIITTYSLVFSYVPKAYLMLKEKAKAFIVFSLAQFVASTGFVLFFIVFNNEGAEGMLKGKMIGALLLIPFYIVMSLRTFKLFFGFSMFKSSFAFSWPSIPTMLSAWILNLSDRVFIERYFSTSEVGVYSLGYNVAGIGLIVFSAFNMAYNPLFYKLANDSDQDTARKKITKYNNVLLICTILITFCIIFFSKEVINLFINDRYKGVHYVVYLISLAYLFSSINSIFAKYIQQSKKVKQAMIIDIATATINIGLNYLLIPIYGIYGAAYATISSFILAFVVSYLYSKYHCYYVPINWLPSAVIFLLGVVLFSLFEYAEINIVISLSIKLFLLAVIVMIFYKKYWTKIKVMLTN